MDVLIVRKFCRRSKLPGGLLHTSPGTLGWDNLRLPDDLAQSSRTILPQWGIVFQRNSFGARYDLSWTVTCPKIL